MPQAAVVDERRLTPAGAHPLCVGVGPLPVGAHRDEVALVDVLVDQTGRLFGNLRKSLSLLTFALSNHGVRTIERRVSLSNLKNVVRETATRENLSPTAVGLRIKMDGDGMAICVMIHRCMRP